MRILVISHYSELYGANRSLINLLQGINKDCVVSVVVPEKGNIIHELDSIDVHCEVKKFYSMFYTDNKSWIKCLLKLPAHLISRYQFKSFVNTLDVDLIYSNSSMQDVGHFCAQKLNIPHVWHIREYGDKDYNRYYFYGNRKLIRQMNMSNRVVTVSESIRSHYVAKGLLNEKSLAIANAAYWKKEIYRRSNSRKGDNFKFSIVAPLLPKKGQLTAVKAFLKTKNEKAILNIYGGGSDSQYVHDIMSLIDASGIKDRVIFHGFVTDQEEIYGNSDCVLLCAKNEALSRVAVECMGRGIPVIGFNGGGNLEVVDHDKTGFLYDDVDDLAVKMKIIAKNNDVREKLSNGAMKKAATVFNIETYSNSMLKIFREAIVE